MKKKGRKKMVTATKTPRETEKRRRRGPVGSVDLEEYVHKVESRAGDLGGLQAAMAELGLDAIEVDGWTKVERAFRLIDEFCDNVQIAIIREKRRRR